MLEPSGRRYFLDKTPAYALVIPFLRKLYPEAHYVVLTRHPMAVMSSYANSFFDGDWHAANEFNPVVNRYVPAMARLLREPTAHVHHVGYEALVRDPAQELARIFTFLGLPNDPDAVNYGERFAAEGAHTKAGSGDPIGVGAHSRPVETSLDKWVGELLGRPQEARRWRARSRASSIRATCAQWGYDPDQLLGAGGGRRSRRRGARAKRSPSSTASSFSARSCWR